MDSAGNAVNPLISPQRLGHAIVSRLAGTQVDAIVCTVGNGAGYTTSYPTEVDGIEFIVDRLEAGAKLRGTQIWRGAENLRALWAAGHDPGRRASRRDRASTPKPEEKPSSATSAAKPQRQRAASAGSAPKLEANPAANAPSSAKSPTKLPGAVSPASKSCAASSRLLDSLDIGCVADLDASAFGISRDRMLSLLAAQSEARVRRDGAERIVGYGMLRLGQRAHYLGPIVAEDESSRIGLAEDLLKSIPDRPLYWDIPDTNQAAIRVA